MFPHELLFFTMSSGTANLTRMSGLFAAGFDSDGDELAISKGCAKEQPL